MSSDLDMKDLHAIHIAVYESLIDAGILVQNEQSWEDAAELIVERLGLTQEWGIVTDMGVRTDRPMSEKCAKGLAADYDDMTARSRWATKWSVE